MSRLRVLMLVDAWYPHVGGGQVHAWELSKKLVDKGCEVEIFTRDLGPWSESYQGIKIIRVGNHKAFANIWGRLDYLIKALGYSLRADYDILHAHAFSPGLLVPIVKFFRRKPAVFTVHGEGLKIAGMGVGGGFLQDLVFYKIPYDLEITVAEKTLIKKSAAKKIVVISNGVNLEDFSSAIRKRSSVKNLIYIGRLFFDKGVDLLIEAFKKKDGMSLTIVGDGPERANLEKKASGLDIRFTGQLQGKKLLDQMKKADLLVMPSRVEGMPLRLLEAWASKLPVVATKAGDNELFIKEDKTGFLADINPASITEEIKKASRADLKAISNAGYSQVKSYTWEKIADQTLKEYQKLV